MTMIKTFAAKMVAILALIALVAPPAAAQGLSAGDLALAFGGNTPTAARSMSAVEMDETEGAFAALIVKGAKAAYDAGKAAYQAKKAAKAAEKAAKNGKKEHTTNQRPSNLEKHQNGQARAQRDQGREKGDDYRKW